MRTAICLLACGLFLTGIPLAGVDNDGAMYIGGTVKTIAEQTEGRLDFSNDDKMVFRWKASAWELPYKQIRSLEYGQKAGRRIGVAIAVNVLAIFSKKRRHFLTIGFEDAEGQKQAALIEIGKARVRTSLAIIEARTGLKVEYESKEAKEHVYG